VEDWEQFFEEKSRRRADKDRRRAKIRIWKTGILIVLMAGVVAGVISLSSGQS
jgi:hypothetical protein